uniref:Histidine kinase/HSP90-like ATPase domain-containing protein n=1 Tax=Gracilinema caldarium TaxID=215591 RepID=A0A7C3EDQ6_9SPIR
MEITNSLGFIEIKFGPRWKYIAVVRAFIQNFIAVSYSDNIRADKIAMAASELLENAVKYAQGEETLVKLQLLPETESIMVSVTNRANLEAIKGLQEIWEKVMQGDPLQAYITQMQLAATRTDSKSQLGLVRIRYETGADMKLDVQGDMVTISLTQSPK